MLPRLAGIAQCAAHVIRCHAVQARAGSLQSRARDVTEILREARQATAGARTRDEPAAHAELLTKLRERHDEAVASGIIRNRHRDRHDGNHPGYAPGCWLRDYADQAWLFTREPSAERASNVSERGAKAARRHQAVSGYWHTQGSLKS
jgi:transposase